MVLLSTHIVSDIEHIADRVLIMRDGQICFDGSWDAHEDLEKFYLAQFGFIKLRSIVSHTGKICYNFSQRRTFPPPDRYTG